MRQRRAETETETSLDETQLPTPPSPERRLEDLCDEKGRLTKEEVPHNSQEEKFEIIVLGDVGCVFGDPRSHLAFVGLAKHANFSEFFQ